MRNKDQILLENAYEQVLNEGIINKTLGTAALAAGMGLGLGELKAKPTQYPNDADGAAIESFNKPEFSPDGAIEEVLNILSDRNFPIGKTTEEGVPINDLPEKLFKGDILLKASMSKNLEALQRLTDLIQLKGYKLPLIFRSARKLVKPIGA